MPEPYFQFPLCALNLQESDRERLECIISYCCIEVGTKRWRALTDSQRLAWRDSPPIHSGPDAKVNPKKAPYLQAFIGAEKLQVTIRPAPSILARHMRLLNHQRAFELKHGRDVQVRLATRFVFEARDNKGMSFREVAVLSAIYSKIGAATGPVRITRDEIRRRAHGFKSKQVFNQEIGLGLPEISERRIRTLIESLHDRGFFARITYARRQTYYSHRLTAEKLADAIFQQKIRRTKAENARIRVNKQLTDRVKAERQQLSASMPEQASRVPLR